MFSNKSQVTPILEQQCPLKKMQARGHIMRTSKYDSSKFTKYNFMQSHFEYDFSSEMSRRIAQEYIKKMKSKRKVYREVPTFADTVRNEVLYLHEYNLTVFKATQLYPFSEEYTQFLMQYVLLECKILYKREYYSKNREKQTQERVLRILLSIYNDYFESKQLKRREVTERSMKSIIEIFVKIRTHYNLKYIILENMTVTLLKKNGHFEKIDALRDKPLPFLLDSNFSPDPSLCIYGNTSTSDYGTDDGLSNAPQTLNIDNCYEVSPILEDDVDEIKDEYGPILGGKGKNTNKNTKFVHTICLDESGLDSDEEIIFETREIETKKKERIKNSATMTTNSTLNQNQHFETKEIETKKIERIKHSATMTTNTTLNQNQHTSDNYELQCRSEDYIKSIVKQSSPSSISDNDELLQEIDNILTESSVDEDKIPVMTSEEIIDISDDTTTSDLPTNKTIKDSIEFSDTIISNSSKQVENHMEIVDLDEVIELSTNKAIDQDEVTKVLTDNYVKESVEFAHMNLPNSSQQIAHTMEIIDLDEETEVSTNKSIDPYEITELSINRSLEESKEFSNTILSSSLQQFENHNESVNINEIIVLPDNENNTRHEKNESNEPRITFENSVSALKVNIDSTEPTVVDTNLTNNQSNAAYSDLLTVVSNSGLLSTSNEDSLPNKSLSEEVSLELTDKVKYREICPRELMISLYQCTLSDFNHFFIEGKSADNKCALKIKENVPLKENIKVPLNIVESKVITEVDGINNKKTVLGKSSFDDIHRKQKNANNNSQGENHSCTSNVSENVTVDLNNDDYNENGNCEIKVKCKNKRYSLRSISDSVRKCDSRKNTHHNSFDKYQISTNNNPDVCHNEETSSKIQPSRIYSLKSYQEFVESHILDNNGETEFKIQDQDTLVNPDNQEDSLELVNNQDEIVQTPPNVETREYKEIEIVDEINYKNKHILSIIPEGVIHKEEKTDQETFDEIPKNQQDFERTVINEQLNIEIESPVNEYEQQITNMDVEHFEETFNEEELVQVEYLGVTAEDQTENENINIDIEVNRGEVTCIKEKEYEEVSDLKINEIIETAKGSTTEIPERFLIEGNEISQTEKVDCITGNQADKEKTSININMKVDKEDEVTVEKVMECEEVTLKTKEKIETVIEISQTVESESIEIPTVKQTHNEKTFIYIDRKVDEEVTHEKEKEYEEVSTHEKIENDTEKPGSFLIENEDKSQFIEVVACKNEEHVNVAIVNQNENIFKRNESTENSAQMSNTEAEVFQGTLTKNVDKFKIRPNDKNDAITGIVTKVIEEPSPHEHIKASDQKEKFSKTNETIEAIIPIMETNIDTNLTKNKEELSQLGHTEELVDTYEETSRSLGEEIEKFKILAEVYNQDELEIEKIETVPFVIENDAREENVLVSLKVAIEYEQKREEEKESAVIETQEPLEKTITSEKVLQMEHIEFSSLVGRSDILNIEEKIETVPFVIESFVNKENIEVSPKVGIEYEQKREIEKGSSVTEIQEQLEKTLNDEKILHVEQVDLSSKVCNSNNEEKIEIVESIVDKEIVEVSPKVRIGYEQKREEEKELPAVEIQEQLQKTMSNETVLQIDFSVKDGCTDISNIEVITNVEEPENFDNTQIDTLTMQRSDNKEEDIHNRSITQENLDTTQIEDGEIENDSTKEECFDNKDDTFENKEDFSETCSIENECFVMVDKEIVASEEETPKIEEVPCDRGEVTYIKEKEYEEVSEISQTVEVDCTTDNQTDKDKTNINIDMKVDEEDEVALEKVEECEEVTLKTMEEIGTVTESDTESIESFLIEDAEISQTVEIESIGITTVKQTQNEKSIINIDRKIDEEVTHEKEKAYEEASALKFNEIIETAEGSNTEIPESFLNEDIQISQTVEVDCTTDNQTHKDETTININMRIDKEDEVTLEKVKECEEVTLKSEEKIETVTESDTEILESFLIEDVEISQTVEIESIAVTTVKQTHNEKTIINIDSKVDEEVTHEKEKEYEEVSALKIKEIIDTAKGSNTEIPESSLIEDNEISQTVEVDSTTDNQTSKDETTININMKIDKEDEVTLEKINECEEVTLKSKERIETVTESDREIPESFLIEDNEILQTVKVNCTTDNQTHKDETTININMKIDKEDEVTLEKVKECEEITLKSEEKIETVTESDTEILESFLIEDDEISQTVEIESIGVTIQTHNEKTIINIDRKVDEEVTHEKEKEYEEVSALKIKEIIDTAKGSNTEIPESFLIEDNEISQTVEVDCTTDNQTPKDKTSINMDMKVDEEDEFTLEKVKEPEEVTKEKIETVTESDTEILECFLIKDAEISQTVEIESIGDTTVKQTHNEKTIINIDRKVSTSKTNKKMVDEEISVASEDETPKINEPCDREQEESNKTIEHAKAIYDVICNKETTQREEKTTPEKTIHTELILKEEETKNVESVSIAVDNEQKINKTSCSLEIHIKEVSVEITENEKEYENNQATFDKGKKGSENEHFLNNCEKVEPLMQTADDEQKQDNLEGIYQGTTSSIETNHKYSFHKSPFINEVIVEAPPSEEEIFFDVAKVSTENKASSYCLKREMETSPAENIGKIVKSDCLNDKKIIQEETKTNILEPGIIISIINNKELILTDFSKLDKKESGMSNDKSFLISSFDDKNKEIDGISKKTFDVPNFSHQVWNMYKDKHLNEERFVDLHRLASVAVEIKQKSETPKSRRKPKGDAKTTKTKKELTPTKNMSVKSRVKRKLDLMETADKFDDDKRITRSTYRKNICENVMKPQEFNITLPINNVKIRQLPDSLTNKDSNDSEFNKLVIDDKKMEDSDDKIYNEDTDEENLVFKYKHRIRCKNNVTIKRNIKNKKPKTKAQIKSYENNLNPYVSIMRLEEKNKQEDTYVDRSISPGNEYSNVEEAIEIKKEILNKSTLPGDGVNYPIYIPPKWRYKLSYKNTVKFTTEKLEQRLKNEGTDITEIQGKLEQTSNKDTKQNNVEGESEAESVDATIKDIEKVDSMINDKITTNEVPACKKIKILSNVVISPRRDTHNHIKMFETQASPEINKSISDDALEKTKKTNNFVENTNSSNETEEGCNKSFSNIKDDIRNTSKGVTVLEGGILETTKKDADIIKKKTKEMIQFEDKIKDTRKHRGIKKDTKYGTEENIKFSPKKNKHIKRRIKFVEENISIKRHKTDLDIKEMNREIDKEIGLTRVKRNLRKRITRAASINKQVDSTKNKKIESQENTTLNNKEDKETNTHTKSKKNTDLSEVENKEMSSKSTPESTSKTKESKETVAVSAPLPFLFDQVEIDELVEKCIKNKNSRSSRRNSYPQTDLDKKLRKHVISSTIKTLRTSKNSRSKSYTKESEIPTGSIPTKSRSTSVSLVECQKLDNDVDLENKTDETVVKMHKNCSTSTLKDDITENKRILRTKINSKEMKIPSKLNKVTKTKKSAKNETSKISYTEIIDKYKDKKTNSTSSNTIPKEIYHNMSIVDEIENQKENVMCFENCSEDIQQKRSNNVEKDFQNENSTVKLKETNIDITEGREDKKANILNVSGEIYHNIPCSVEESSINEIVIEKSKPSAHVVGGNEDKKKLLTSIDSISEETEQRKTAHEELHIENKTGKINDSNTDIAVKNVDKIENIMSIDNISKENKHEDSTNVVQECFKTEIITKTSNQTAIDITEQNRCQKTDVTHIGLIPGEVEHSEACNVDEKEHLQNISKEFANILDIQTSIGLVDEHTDKEATNVVQEDLQKEIGKELDKADQEIYRTIVIKLTNDDSSLIENVPMPVIEETIKSWEENTNIELTVVSSEETNQINEMEVGDNNFIEKTQEEINKLHDMKYIEKDIKKHTKRVRDTIKKRSRKSLRLKNKLKKVPFLDGNTLSRKMSKKITYYEAKNSAHLPFTLENKINKTTVSDEKDESNGVLQFSEQKECSTNTVERKDVNSEIRNKAMVPETVESHKSEVTHEKCNINSKIGNKEMVLEIVKSLKSEIIHQYCNTKTLGQKSAYSVTGNEEMVPDTTESHTFQITHQECFINSGIGNEEITPETVETRKSEIGNEEMVLETAESHKSEITHQDYTNISDQENALSEIKNKDTIELHKSEITHQESNINTVNQESSNSGIGNKGIVPVNVELHKSDIAYQECNINDVGQKDVSSGINNEDVVLESVKLHKSEITYQELNITDNVIAEVIIESSKLENENQVLHTVNENLSVIQGSIVDLKVHPTESLETTEVVDMAAVLLPVSSNEPEPKDAQIRDIPEKFTESKNESLKDMVIETSQCSSVKTKEGKSELTLITNDTAQVPKQIIESAVDNNEELRNLLTSEVTISENYQSVGNKIDDIELKSITEKVLEDTILKSSTNEENYTKNNQEPLKHSIQEIKVEENDDSSLVIGPFLQDENTTNKEELKHINIDMEELKHTSVIEDSTLKSDQNKEDGSKKLQLETSLILVDTNFAMDQNQENTIIDKEIINNKTPKQLLPERVQDNSINQVELEEDDNIVGVQSMKVVPEQTSIVLENKGIGDKIEFEVPQASLEYSLSDEVVNYNNELLNNITDNKFDLRDYYKNSVISKNNKISEVQEGSFITSPTTTVASLNSEFKIHGDGKEKAEIFNKRNNEYFCSTDKSIAFEENCRTLQDNNSRTVLETPDLDRILVPFLNNQNFSPTEFKNSIEEPSVQQKIRTVVVDEDLHKPGTSRQSSLGDNASKEVHTAELKKLQSQPQENLQNPAMIEEIMEHRLPFENQFYLPPANQLSGSSQMKVSDGTNDHNYYSNYTSDPVMSIAEDGGEMSLTPKEFTNVILNFGNESEFLDFTSSLMELDLADENASRRESQPFQSWDNEPKVIVEYTNQANDTPVVIRGYINDCTVSEPWGEQNSEKNQQSFHDDLFNQQSGPANPILAEEITISASESLDANIKMTDANLKFYDMLNITTEAVSVDNIETVSIDRNEQLTHQGQVDTTSETPHCAIEKSISTSGNSCPSEGTSKSKKVVQQLALYKKMKEKQSTQSHMKRNNVEIPSRKCNRTCPRKWTKMSSSPSAKVSELLKLTEPERLPVDCLNKQAINTIPTGAASASKPSDLNKEESPSVLLTNDTVSKQPIEKDRVTKQIDSVSNKTKHETSKPFVSSDLSENGKYDFKNLVPACKDMDVKSDMLKHSPKSVDLGCINSTSLEREISTKTESVNISKIDHVSKRNYPKTLQMPNALPDSKTPSKVVQETKPPSKALEESKGPIIKSLSIALPETKTPSKSIQETKAFSKAIQETKAPSKALEESKGPTTKAPSKALPETKILSKPVQETEVFSKAIQETKPLRETKAIQETKVSSKESIKSLTFPIIPKITVNRLQEKPTIVKHDSYLQNSETSSRNKNHRTTSTVQLSTTKESLRDNVSEKSDERSSGARVSSVSPNRSERSSRDRSSRGGSDTSSFGYDSNEVTLNIYDAVKQRKRAVTKRDSSVENKSRSDYKTRRNKRKKSPDNYQTLKKSKTSSHAEDKDTQDRIPTADLKEMRVASSTQYTAHSTSSGNQNNFNSNHPVNRTSRDSIRDWDKRNAVESSSKSKSQKTYKSTDDDFDRLVIEGNKNPCFNNPNQVASSNSKSDRPDLSQYPYKRCIDRSSMDAHYGNKRRLGDQSSIRKNDRSARPESSQRNANYRSSMESNRSQLGQRPSSDYYHKYAPICPSRESEDYYSPRKSSSSRQSQQPSSYGSSTSNISNLYRRSDGHLKHQTPNTSLYTTKSNILSDEKRNELLEDLKSVVQMQLNKSSKSNNSENDWYQGIEPLLSENPHGFNKRE